jgi:hypothetical protein
MTNLIFNFCNIMILLAWGTIIVFPKQKLSKVLISFPWIPLGLSFFLRLFYIYFWGHNGS